VQRAWRNVETRRPCGSGFRARAGGWRSQETWSFSFSPPTRSSTPRLDLGLALVAHDSARFARSGVSGLLCRLELVHDLGDRAPRDLASELGRLAVDHVDRRLLDARDQGGRLRRNRPAQNGQRLIGRLGAIEVERPAHQGAGAPAEKQTDRPAQNADEHPDQRAARGADEADVVGALWNAQLARRGPLHDRRGLQPDATTGVALLQHAQRLVGLARLREPSDHDVFLSHCYSLRLNINANRTLSRINAKRMPRVAAPLPPRSVARSCRSPRLRRIGGGSYDAFPACPIIAIRCPLVGHTHQALPAISSAFMGWRCPGHAGRA